MGADVVILDQLDAVEQQRAERILPRPQRQRMIRQRPEIGVEHQRLQIQQNPRSAAYENGRTRVRPPTTMGYARARGRRALGSCLGRCPMGLRCLVMIVEANR
jgi:hypothetical protein